ncbi:Crp/Fnr family transcriptional regulator [Enterococcus lactis]|uniref:Crp/Fnr family transcriptional regulator n=1 Tax=Enterococcus lactis TaxID=357441 RepID=UPI0012E184DE|nr:Crp/Fnr family transcriptional regulator [Enterococcus lactis]MUP35944.1 cyclic nucleotide-binding domain-containing protein [Enterococcus lactis]QXM05022.1 Crp/Fnr family transcriptional regulator [Enterococcus lactis]
MTKHTHHEIGDHAACIRLVPIFNHLEDSAMNYIAEKAHAKQYQKGEFLFRSQEKEDTLYIINRGKIRIYRLADSGKEQLVRILNPGDFTGEWTLFNPDAVHEEYAEATRDTVVCMIQQKDVQDFLEQYPAISLKLLAEMSKRLESSERQTTQVAVESVITRLVLFLAENVEPEMGNSPTITLPMAKKDIASYLGTTPETISRKFGELEDEGLIQQLSGKRIKIQDLDDLLLYSE